MKTKKGISPCRGCANELKDKSECMEACLALDRFIKGRKWKPKDRLVAGRITVQQKVA